MGGHERVDAAPHRLSRRSLLALSSAAAIAPLLPGKAFADVATDMPLHGLSAFGELKYPADFSHFGYVNPEAPKGGRMHFAPPNSTFNQSFLTFNTLNSFVLNGDSPPRTEFCFDSLMTSALDEPDSIYGLLAESVSLSTDRNSFTFKLRPEARFHDGTPLTAEDVVFTYELLKKEGHPNLSQPLRFLEKTEAIDPATVRLTFNGEQPAQVILTVATMSILSKAYYTENTFNEATMKPPLGSGPYRIGRVSSGQTIEYERVEDYWGKDLPVNRGLNNFDRIRIDFYQDRQASFEAFKKGDTHFRQEFTSRVWATEYTFPALNDGRVIKREFPRELMPQMQAVAINTRRAQFADPRTRQAIALCFNFEATNRSLFYGLYHRSNSNFEQSDFMATGQPSPEELALLEPFRAELPEAVFADAYIQPKGDESGRDRRVLMQASKLLADAGWKRQGSGLVNERGETLRAEFLTSEEGLVRLFTPWADNMKRIGIQATIRMVDQTQYEQRQNDYDFDLNMLAWSMGATPTAVGLEILYHSRSADLPGNRNYPGTESPAIDALIASAGRAATRDELVTALRALDRILRVRFEWIPTYHAAVHRAAYWDMFGFVEPKPDYGFPVEILWWYDEAKARAVGRA